MHLYLIVGYDPENQQWLCFLLFALSRQSAKDEIKAHCGVMGVDLQKIQSHDVTLKEGEIQRIDTLVP